MQIDQSVIGRDLGTFTAQLERGRIRLFADVIGEEDPIYKDIQAARDAGHPDIPAPPTFLFGFVLEQPDSTKWFDDLGINLGHVLHAQQDFAYFSRAYAGDELTFSARIADVFHKRNGELTFIVRGIEVTRPDGSRVMEMRDTITVVKPKEG